MTAGSQEWSKYPFLIKSNRPGTKRGRSTAGRPTTILSLGISDHYKPKGRFFCDSKERFRYDLIEVLSGISIFGHDIHLRSRCSQPVSNDLVSVQLTSRTSRFVTRNKCFLRRSEFLALSFSDFGILQVQ